MSGGARFVAILVPFGASGASAPAPPALCVPAGAESSAAAALPLFMIKCGMVSEKKQQ